MSTCPAGHTTTADDYCDTCGLPVVAGGPGDTGLLPTTPAAPTAPDSSASGTPSGTCPHCSAANPADALFCEACGYDFTTGSLPRPVEPLAPPAVAGTDGAPAAPVVPSTPAAAAAPAEDLNPAPPPAEAWVAEIWIDPDWYSDQKSTDPLPSPGLPTVVALKHRSVLIGRASRSRGISPDIDLSSDNGISRRHAQLTTDGTRWFVEDLGSSNGTYVGSSVGPLPTEALPVGQRREFDDDDRVYLGAWTRLVIRRAAPGEG
ncbi:FHA domain-containing protein [Nocardioides nanhaiensis]|uniref:FHA domain-containing protein n=1 Tax=Nocardioides nanhaiensis TaxID=1476871 RepID=A0ABP8W5Y8_9ACTN